MPFFLAFASRTHTPPTVPPPPHSAPPPPPQVDEHAADAQAFRRNQRDVWAEWLTYSSAQIADISTGNGNTISTSINGSAYGSGRPTHASDDLPYAVTSGHSWPGVHRNTTAAAGAGCAASAGADGGYAGGGCGGSIST